MITMTPNQKRLLNELKIKNAETYYHSVCVKNVTLKMLNLMIKDGIVDYTPKQVEYVCKGALLHDIGKLYVKNRILTKEDTLTPEERHYIREHTRLGFEAVEKDLNNDEYEIIKNICLHHHERVDGGGYESIKDLPIYVQAVSAADAFSALFYDRVYRKGLPYNKTISMIEAGDCGCFDDMIVDYLKKATGNLSK